MKNKEIRDYAKTEGVKLWQIAECLGLNDGNFSRKLRRELSNDEKAQIKSIIDDIVRNEVKPYE